MNGSWFRFIVWAPRVLTILFALFLSLFALDVFEAGQDLGRVLIGFFVHLWPAALVILLLVLAWRWEWIGAAGYALLAVLYILRIYGNADLSVYAVIPLPLLVIAGLFLAGWILRRRRMLTRQG